MAFRLGDISERITKRVVIIFLSQFIIIAFLLGYNSYMDSSESCISCHGDKEKMTKLGYPQFYMTLDDVRKETGHKHILCRDCHLGNGRSSNPERAHRWMLKMLFVDHKGDVLKRGDIYTKEDTEVNSLKPRGNDRLFENLPKINTDEGFQNHPSVRNILWHDRDPKTLNFDPSIAEKTCGRRGCHQEELRQFRHTIMATNMRQRTMRTWFEPYGPHNCGPSFADLPPVEVLDSSDFDFKNTKKIQDELNITFLKEQAIVKQKLCNVCHAGCLDCHYTPGKDGKTHSFTKVPDSLSCLGWGRGNSTCHPGAMQSRRGETYVGGDYSIPRGMEGDIHFKKNIHCIDCHLTGRRGMGDMERKASCQDCHIEIEDALKESIHKNLTCTACHVTEAGGYQITVWGRGIVGDKENPFKKYAYYYGVQSPLILMKDQKGIWFPVKIWPHSVSNIKKDAMSSGVRFRWPNGETRDMYAILGTFDDLPSANKHLIWLEIEEVSHPFRKSRDCRSCHSGKQVTISRWEFQDDQGAEPFIGGYRIEADENGLRIVDFWNTEIKVLEGYTLSDFAPWIYLKDKWHLKGDFSIKTDQKKYKEYLRLDEEIRKTTVPELKERLGIKEALKPNIIKAIAIHNPDGVK